jgi:cytochrome c-type biogenesis protein CcmH
MIFWIIAAALLVLALVILLVPLMRSSNLPREQQRQQQNVQIAREKKQQLDGQLADGEIDQAGFDSAYLDLQTALALELGNNEADSEMARGKWMAVVLLLAIPLASIALYMVYGEYRVIENPELVRVAPVHQNSAAPQMTLEEMNVAIKQRLRDNPEDGEGWYMLGRTHMAGRQYGEAVAAFQRSNDLIANEPGIIFALADAMAMQNDGSLLGEPEALIERGLAIAPRFPNGLWLAGMAAEQRQDYPAAHRYWTLLLPMIADNPTSTEEIRGLIAMLEERDPQLASPDKPAGSGARLNLLVDISAELKAKADPAATVFIYAKAMQGPPMPLAVRRMKLSDLPVSISLGDEDAMMPSMKLSAFDQVIVGARVSSSGQPIAQTGDFYTELEAVDNTNPPAQIVLTIDQVK